MFLRGQDPEENKRLARQDLIGLLSWIAVLLVALAFVIADLLSLP